MLPLESTLTPPQRAGYALSLVCLSGGWLLLVLCLLEWPGLLWSRAALSLQGAALLVALPLAVRVPARRLVLYPLVLAASTYLWDTTLPPPTLPRGWPRALVPPVVLVGLLLDYAWAVQHARHHRQAAPSAAQVRPAAAVPLREPAAATARRRLPQDHHVRSGAAAQPGDTTGALISARQRRRTPPWWQLYLWLGLMSGLLLGVVPRIPPAWETVAQATWCVLTLGGMAVWVRVHRSVLALYDQEKHRPRRHRAAPPATAERTIPLTPVQRRFLEATKRHERRER